MLCPICGTEFQGMVADQNKWYAERYPDAPVGSLVPEQCMDCYAEIEVGDTVELRVSVAGDPDCDVVIDRIVKTPMGDRCIYFVRTPDGQALRTRAGDDRAFIRAQLRKRTGRIVEPPDDGIKHRGYF